MNFWRRLFANSYEKALTNPGDYEAKVDSATLRKDLEKDPVYARASEVRSGMLEILKDTANVKQTSIASLVEQADMLRYAIHNTQDRHLSEWGKEALAHTEILARFMIERANAQLAGCKPGAADKLGKAFD